MHKIFGEKLNTNYRDRAGAYLICIKEGKIAVVKTPKGYFLLGGGFEADESAEVCITRECIEEIGYTVKVGEKLCSAEHYTYHKRIGYFHPIQHYYMGELIRMEESFTVEKDHTLMWFSYDEIKGKMFSPMQNWAVDMAWKKVHNADLSKFRILNEAPSADDYNHLRISSGIGGAKDIEKARTALKNSLFAVSVYDGNKLIGSGRITKATAPLLSAFKSLVTIASRNPDSLLWNEIFGFNTINTAHISESVGDYDLIINTAPKKILTENILSRLKKDCLVIDLASRPGGVDMDSASRLGVRVIWALGLPGKCAPVSAGHIIGSTVLNMLNSI